MKLSAPESCHGEWCNCGFLKRFFHRDFLSVMYFRIHFQPPHKVPLVTDSANCLSILGFLPHFCLVVCLRDNCRFLSLLSMWADVFQNPHPPSRIFYNDFPGVPVCSEFKRIFFLGVSLPFPSLCFSIIRWSSWTRPMRCSPAKASLVVWVTRLKFQLAKQGSDFDSWPRFVVRSTNPIY